MKYGLRLYAFTDGTVIIRDGKGYTRYPKGSRIGFGEQSIFTVVLVFDSYEKWCMDNELDASVIKDYHPPNPTHFNCRSSLSYGRDWSPENSDVRSDIRSALRALAEPDFSDHCEYCNDKGLVVLGGALEPCPICHGECIKDVVVKDGGK